MKNQYDSAFIQRSTIFLVFLVAPKLEAAMPYNNHIGTPRAEEKPSETDEMEELQMLRLGKKKKSRDSGGGKTIGKAIGITVAVLPFAWYGSARAVGVLSFRNTSSWTVIQDTLERFLDGSESSVPKTIDTIVSQYIMKYTWGLGLKQVLFVVCALAVIWWARSLLRKHKGKWKGYIARAARRIKAAKMTLRSAFLRAGQLAEGLRVAIKPATHRTFSVCLSCDDAAGESTLIRAFAADHTKPPIVPLAFTTMFSVASGDAVSRSIPARLYFTGEEVYLVSKRPFHVVNDHQYTRKYALSEQETTILFEDKTGGGQMYHFHIGSDD